METNKETRMIPPDEIFYAVLKDGTVVSNFREVAESKERTDKIPLLLKELFNSDLNLLKETKSYPLPICAQAYELLLLAFGLVWRRHKEKLKTLLEEVCVKIETGYRKEDEADDRHGDDDK